MNNLLRANFARLWKSRIFWLGILYSIGMGVIASTTQYREMILIPGHHPHIDNILFSIGLFMPVVSAVFTGLFLGTEYSDGTIRNKLIVGKTRAAVYLSNLAVCAAAVILIHLANLATILAIGFPLVGNVESTFSGLMALTLISLATLIALTAIWLFLGMLIHSKPVYCVTILLISIFLLMNAMIVENNLAEKEYIDAYSFSYTDASGEIFEEYVEQTPNPRYLSGFKREVYEFLYDFMPGCQLLQIAHQETAHPGQLPLYSLLIFAVSTGCGLFFFRIKNIK